MRVKLLGKAQGLKERVESQGDDVIAEREDLALGENGHPVTISSEVLRLMQIPSAEGGNYSISRWLGQDWHSQVLVQIHANKFMAGDLGVSAYMGSVGRFYDAGEIVLEGVFESEAVRAAFETGWVTAWIEQGVVSYVQSGLPHYGWFHLAEHIPSRIGDTFSNFEDYTVPANFVAGAVLSRYPWPAGEDDKFEKVHVDGLAPGVTRHLWNLGISGETRTAWTDKNLIAYATGWGQDPRTASSRSITTCKNIIVPLKQYRSDMPWYFHAKWEETHPFASIGA